MKTVKPPVFLFLISLSGFSQDYKEMMRDPSVNFYDVVREAEQYFENNPKGKVSDYTPFQRWKYENEPHYYPSGIRNQSSQLLAQKAYEDYVVRNPRTAAIVLCIACSIGKIKNAFIGQLSVGLEKVGLL